MNRRIVPALILLTAMAAAAVSYHLILSFYERSLRAQFPAEVVIQGNPTARIVFLGDSRVMAWAEHDQFDALYIGFPGATASQIASRVEELPWHTDTETVVIQAGVNDLRILGLAPEERDQRVAATHADLQKLVAASLAHSKEVLLLLVLPVGEPRLSRVMVWSKEIAEGLRLLNQKLSTTAWPEAVRLIDATRQLGEFNASMFTDELHFSSTAYTALNGVVGKHIEAHQH